MDDDRDDTQRFRATPDPTADPPATPGDLRETAAGLGDRARQQGKAMAAQRKDAAAAQMDSAAQALHKTATDLSGSQHPQAGRYVGYAAEQLEGLGQRLRDNDIDSLIGQAESLGRRSPVAFFAGAVAAGFFASRFLKSSAGHRDDESRLAEPRPDSPRPAAWPPTRVDPIHQDVLDPGDANAAVFGADPFDADGAPLDSPATGRNPAPSRHGDMP